METSKNSVWDHLFDLSHSGGTPKLATGCSCICLSFPFSFPNICESGAESSWARVAHTELICAAPSLFSSPSLHYGPKQTVWDLNMRLFTHKAFRCCGSVLPVPPYGPLKASWCHFSYCSACFPQKRLQTLGFLCYFCYSLSCSNWWGSRPLSLINAELVPTPTLSTPPHVLFHPLLPILKHFSKCSVLPRPREAPR